MYKTITKLITLSLTLLLATNLNAMEDGMEEHAPIKRKHSKQQSKGHKKRRKKDKRHHQKLRLSKKPSKKHGGETKESSSVWSQEDEDTLNQELWALIEPPRTDQEAQANIPSKAQELRRILQKLEDTSKKSALHATLEQEDYEEAENVMSCCNVDINKELYGTSQTILEIMATQPTTTRMVGKLSFLLQHGADIFRRNVAGESIVDTVDKQIKEMRQTRKKISASFLKAKAYMENEHNKRIAAAILAMREVTGDSLPKELLNSIIGRLVENTPHTLNKFIQAHAPVKTVERALIGIDIHTPNQNGKTPLHLATRLNRFDIAKLLLRNSTACVQDHEGEAPLHIAALGTDAFITTLLLENHANIEAKTNDGYTPLHIATKNGRLNNIACLLKKGANTNTQNKYGSTPLHSACKNMHLKIVKQLQKYGADITIKDRARKTPLEHLKSRLDQSEEYFAQSKPKDSKPIDLLDAVIKGEIELVYYLLKKNKDSVKEQDEYGLTPLHYAASSRQPLVTKLLLENGAQVQSQDENGRTPLHEAVGTEGDVAKNQVQLLIQGGADVNKQDNDGRTPLHEAYLHDSPTLIKLLEDNGADKTINDNDYRTPSEYEKSAREWREGTSFDPFQPFEIVEGDPNSEWMQKLDDECEALLDPFSRKSTTNKGAEE